jgi:hypothetical protein
MSVHAPVHQGATRAAATAPKQPAHPVLRFLAWAAGVIAGWVVLAAAMSLLWQHAFGFSIDEARALSVGLLAMISILVAILLLTNHALSKDV